MPRRGHVGPPLLSSACEAFVRAHGELRVVEIGDDNGLLDADTTRWSHIHSLCVRQAYW